MMPYSLRKYRKTMESREISVGLGFIEYHKDLFDIDNHSLDDYEDLGEVFRDG